DRARARRGHAYTDLAGELGVRARHERAHLLVARADELRLAFGAAQRSHQSVDAVAGISVDAVHAPLAEALNDEIANQCRHFDSIRFEADFDDARQAVKQG